MRMWAVMVAAVGVLLPPLAASASPATLAWSTYLRAGPAQSAAAVDELAHDTTVDLIGCTGGWCRVGVAGAVGYVDREALVLPRAPALSKAAPPGACVVAAQPGSRRPEPTRFCTPR